MKKILLTLMTLATLFLTGCSNMAYKQGIDGNVALYKLYNQTQNKQLDSINTCYQHNPNKSECAILAASTNTTQILAGRAEALRVAKSPGEIIESITKDGLDKAVTIFGYAAVSKVISKGFTEAAKDPLVVEPSVNVIRPEIVHSGQTGASVINTETIGIGTGAPQ